MNSTLGVSAIQKPYTQCKDLVSSVASLAVFELDGNASERGSCPFFIPVQRQRRLCFYLRVYTPYTNIETSGHNAPKCIIARQKLKIFLGGAHN